MRYTMTGKTTRQANRAMKCLNTENCNETESIPHIRTIYVFVIVLLSGNAQQK